MLIYRIISISRNSQKDLMSHFYRRKVREFDQLMVNFLEFADQNRVDVVIDFNNFIHKAVDSDAISQTRDKEKIQKMREYCLHLFTSQKHRKDDDFLISEEEKKTFEKLVLKSLKVVIKERRLRKRLQNPQKKINILLVTQKSYSKNPEFQALFQKLQQIDENVKIDALFTPKFEVTFGRKRRLKVSEKS